MLVHRGPLAVMIQYLPFFFTISTPLIVAFSRPFPDGTNERSAKRHGRSFVTTRHRHGPACPALAAALRAPSQPCHRHGPACPVLAAALRTRSGPCHRYGPARQVLAAALRARWGPSALPLARAARPLQTRCP